MAIQWFPGHMAKARRQVQEKLKLVDFVIELVDARAPLSSQNPMLHQILNNKPKLVVLMKSDLADPLKTIQWLTHFKEKDLKAIAVDVKNNKDIKQVIKSANEVAKDKMDRLIRKGVRPRAPRAMIIGIPNVGKSTLINKLASKKVAKTGDRPGVTTAQQWIKVKKDFELLDTPGILWPKFNEEIIGYRLAAIGTIKDQILSLQDIAIFALEFLKENYPERLEERYQLDKTEKDMEKIFETIGRLRGTLETGGGVKNEKVAEIVLQDLRQGRLGPITLEDPNSSK